MHLRNLCCERSVFIWHNHSPAAATWLCTESKCPNFFIDVGSINYFEYNFMTNCPKCPISKNPLRHQITCLGRKGSFGLAHLGVQVDSFSPTGTSETLQIMPVCCKCMQHALLSISAQKLAPAIFLRRGTLIERHASMCTHALVLACYFGRPSHANCIWPAHRHRLWNPRNTKILPTTYYRIG